MFYVYTIKSLTKNYIYVGLTTNINRRVAEHNNKRERTTRSYTPYVVIYTESFVTRKEARTREKYLKSGIGKEFLKSL